MKTFILVLFYIAATLWMIWEAGYPIVMRRKHKKIGYTYPVGVSGIALIVQLLNILYCTL